MLIVSCDRAGLVHEDGARVDTSPADRGLVVGVEARGVCRRGVEKAMGVT